MVVVVIADAISDKLPELETDDDDDVTLDAVTGGERTLETVDDDERALETVDDEDLTP